MLVGSFARRWLLLFAGLFALTSPFRYQLLPNVGQWLRPTLEAGVATLAGRWLPGHAALFSDSPGLYIYAGLLGLGTALAAAGWAWRSQRGNSAAEAQLWYGLHTGAAWLLGLHLLAYGFDKVFKS